MWDKTCKKWASMEKGPFHLLSSHWFTFRGLEESIVAQVQPVNSWWTHPLYRWAELTGTYRVNLNNFFFFLLLILRNVFCRSRTVFVILMCCALCCRNLKTHGSTEYMPCESPEKLMLGDRHELLKWVQALSRLRMQRLWNSSGVICLKQGLTDKDLLILKFKLPQVLFCLKDAS